MSSETKFSSIGTETHESCGGNVTEYVASSGSLVKSCERCGQTFSSEPLL